MRTPVVLICGQTGTDDVTAELAREPGTLVVRHRDEGRVVLRSVITATHTTELPLELVRDCPSCTVRDDLLVLLRRLHRRGDVKRIVVELMPWLDPEPVCWAIDNVRVRVGPDYIDGPAALDVRVDAVVTCLDPAGWITAATGDDDLNDGRTVAQVLVGQAEFADVLVLAQPHPRTTQVLRRLAPRAHRTVGAAGVTAALAGLDPSARRGRTDGPHDPLLIGEPVLETDDEIGLLLFTARRPFHPERLHHALDHLLDGVVRARGRLWLANHPDEVLWMESAGGGMHFEHAGKWLAAMDRSEFAYADPQRRALAAADWDDTVGDRQAALSVLVCGAEPEAIAAALRDALLTDAEARRPNDWPTYRDPFVDWYHPPADIAPTRGEDR